MLIYGNYDWTHCLLPHEGQYMICDIRAVSLTGGPTPSNLGSTREGCRGARPTYALDSNSTLIRGHP